MEILGRLHAVVDGARCYRLRYGEAEDAVRVVRQAFARWPTITAAEKDAPAPKVATSSFARPPARACFRRGADVVETALEDDIFLARPNDTEIYRLNPTGAALWRLFAEPLGATAAAAALAQAFPEVAAERIEADVAALIADLAGRGLIEPLESDESRG